jgi:ABC-type thiamine transport system substrate-binding protein
MLEWKAVPQSLRGLELLVWPASVCEDHWVCVVADLRRNTLTLYNSLQVRCG